MLNRMKNVISVLSLILFGFYHVISTMILHWNLPAINCSHTVKSELVKRNVHVGSVHCPLCDSGDDSVVHLFAACSVAQEVWSAIGHWCRLSPIIAFDVTDLLQTFKGAEGGKWGKIIAHDIIMVSCWCIWRARNESVFQDKKTSDRIVIANITRLAFLWCKHRSKFKDLSWENWLKSPLYML
ncbi:uncharacterized protein LOC110898051 [Helianthus annuus]|uniref:uncharacterized protein LOC110898051 n=1 Tax=Helianthus annuus TaxID=4232 RepID=UPI000B8FBEF6|nr:uncharacterized protein LOC110898051 [Helianthus annuus]